MLEAMSLSQAMTKAAVDEELMSNNVMSYMDSIRYGGRLAKYPTSWSLSFPFGP